MAHYAEAGATLRSQPVFLAWSTRTRIEAPQLAAENSILLVSVTNLQCVGAPGRGTAGRH